jgi:hypothetical protein
MIKLTNILSEMIVNKPDSGIFKNNSLLYKFLNKNIEEFARYELNSNSNLSIAVFEELFNNYDWDNDPENFGDEDYIYNTDFTGMPQHLQQAMINYLVEQGLEYYGEWKSEEDNDETYGIAWNIEVGIFYNWTDKADPGSYSWSEEKLKGRIFYSLSFNM